ncbi:lipopolysaccharide biosynthesis protein [Rhodoligotrophos ferricapiens]|uniref:lipopolysaccharide biosynthesis protein n=1 Tax=Rhodoligotrophos ferricapiens TaxID=3069264 RepID=UPI00315DF91D
MRENALPIPIGAARLRRSFGQAFIYRGLGALAGYLTVLLLARFAAPQDFGWFATALAIITLGPSVAGAGQPMAVLRFVRRGTARTGSDDRFLRASASVNVIGAVTTGLALAVIGELSLRLELLSAPPGLFLWTGLAVAALTALEWASAVLRAQGRLSEAFIPREILWRVGCLAGIIFCLSTGQGIDARLTLAMIAVSLLICLALQWRNMHDSIPTAAASLEPGERTGFRRLGRDLWIIAMSQPLANQVGLLVLGSSLSLESAGLFLFLDRTAQLLVFVLTSLAAIASPMMAQLRRDGDLDGLRVVFMSTCVYGGAAALGLFALLILLGPALLSFISPAYGEAYPFLLLLALGQVVNAATGPAAALLMVADHEHLAMRLGLLFNGLGLVLVASGALAFGLPGAVVASFATTAVRSTVAFACCLHILGLRQRFSSRRDR